MPHKQGTLLAYYSTCDTIPILPSAVNESGALAAAGQAGWCIAGYTQGQDFVQFRSPRRRSPWMKKRDGSLSPAPRAVHGPHALARLRDDLRRHRDIARRRGYRHHGTGGDRGGLGSYKRTARPQPAAAGALHGMGRRRRARRSRRVVSLPGDHRQGLRRDSENRRTVGELGHAGAADPAGGRAALPGARRGRRAATAAGCSMALFRPACWLPCRCRSSSAAWC